MYAHEDIFDHNFLCNRQAIYNILESTESGEGKSGCVPTDPSTNLVEQPIDLFLNGPAHMTFLHVGITARCYPIGQVGFQHAAEG